MAVYIPRATRYRGTSTVNSLVPGRFEQSFRQIIFQLNSVTDGWGIFCKIALRWMPLDHPDDKSTMVRVMAWCRQATSHYLSQFDLDPCRHMASPGHNELTYIYMMAPDVINSRGVTVHWQNTGFMWLSNLPQQNMTAHPVTWLWFISKNDDD